MPDPRQLNDAATFAGKRYTKRANRNLVRTYGASRVDILLMTIAATCFECIDFHRRHGFSRFHLTKPITDFAKLGRHA